MAVSFRSLALTPPPALGALGVDLAASLADVSAGLAAGAGSLGNLGLPDLPPLPSLPGAPPSAEALRGSQCALLSRQVQCLMLSPYDYGIGQRRGEAAWLTPVDALREMAGRMGTFASFGNGALVLLLAAGVDQTGIGQMLRSLSTAYPIPELQKLERRVQGVANLDKDKFVIPSTPSWPAQSSRGPESLPLSREASRAIGAQLAQAEGREAAQKSVGDVMSGFADRQAASVQKSVQDMSSVAARLAAGADLSGWFGLYLEGASAEVGRLLAGMAPPVDEVFKCASLLCWYGERADVQYYKELFNL